MLPIGQSPLFNAVAANIGELKTLDIRCVAERFTMRRWVTVWSAGLLIMTPMTMMLPETGSSEAQIKRETLQFVTRANFFDKNPAFSFRSTGTGDWFLQSAIPQNVEVRPQF
jgi:hypothetical protein